MKLVVLAVALVSLGSTSALAADQVGERCTGTETVQVGTQPPRTIAYSLNFSVDLASKSYCYDKCLPEQTYAISDATSNPLKLADLDRGGQTRRLTFDRNKSVLTDYQVIAGGLVKVVRNASATCQAAKFHRPLTETKAEAK
ncbi:MAG TPA: hypothetical protein VN137_14750 [Sphingomonas sp.]|nr:hypothetical protein [Sphingomonas sp.]